MNKSIALTQARYLEKEEKCLPPPRLVDIKVWPHFLPYLLKLCDIYYVLKCFERLLQYKEEYLSFKHITHHLCSVLRLSVLPVKFQRNVQHPKNKLGTQVPIS